MTPRWRRLLPAEVRLASLSITRALKRPRQPRPYGRAPESQSTLLQGRVHTVRALLCGDELDTAAPKADGPLICRDKQTSTWLTSTALKGSKLEDLAEERGRLGCPSGAAPQGSPWGTPLSNLTRLAAVPALARACRGASRVWRRAAQVLCWRVRPAGIREGWALRCCRCRWPAHLHRNPRSQPSQSRTRCSCLCMCSIPWSLNDAGLKDGEPGGSTRACRPACTAGSPPRPALLLLEAQPALPCPCPCPCPAFMSPAPHTSHPPHTPHPSCSLCRVQPHRGGGHDRPHDPALPRLRLCDLC